MGKITENKVDLHPDYQSDDYLNEAYSEQMLTEYRQCLDEGLDIEKYEGLFGEISKLSSGKIKDEMCSLVFDLINELPLREDYKYSEPSEYDEIRLEKAGNDISQFTCPSADRLKEKLKGAWYGRVIGCLLGKPVEGMRRNELIPFLKASGNYPMHRYISKNDVTEDMITNYSFNLRGRCFADAVDCAPADDDTNYTVMASEIIEQYGRDFKPADVAKMWILMQSKEAYFTAERVAFKNFINGFTPPKSAIYKNPFREWIGAQIRGDYFGYINPGNPEKAAEMAFRDASISHIKNGIYGEMFIAAMLAAAPCFDDMEKIIRAGLNEIPSKSRLYEAVESIIEDYKRGVSEEAAFARICETWNDADGYDWCHTISNAQIVTAALLYGKGDFDKTICLAVQTGFDTDCNGATSGSILGMAKGINAIDEKWLNPIKGKLHTGLFGMETVDLDLVIERSLKHMQG